MKITFNPSTSRIVAKAYRDEAYLLGGEIPRKVVSRLVGRKIQSNTDFPVSWRKITHREVDLLGNLFQPLGIQVEPLSGKSRRAAINCIANAFSQIEPTKESAAIRLVDDGYEFRSAVAILHKLGVYKDELGWLIENNSEKTFSLLPFNIEKKFAAKLRANLTIARIWEALAISQLCIAFGQNGIGILGLVFILKAIHLGILMKQISSYDKVIKKIPEIIDELKKLPDLKELN